MKIGDKVVCVGHSKKTEPFNPQTHRVIGEFPVVNSVYVIAKFNIDEIGVLGLILIGSSAVHIPTGVETGWDSSCFRLLDELKERSANLQTIQQTQT